MLRLITAWSSDALAEWLAEWFATAPEDPFARELVLVPTPGMERYVTRFLARRLGVSEAAAQDGVCAAVDFRQPQELMASVLAEAMPDDDPWAPAALQWHCLAAVDDLLLRDDERLLGLRHHLRAGTRGARRMGVAREVAALLHNYANQRPELLLAWAADDTDGSPAQFWWQSQVFRHVLERTGTAPWPLRVRELLEDGIGDAALPPRLAVFGVTRYGTLERQFLEALARDRDVAVLMVEHSPARAEPGPPGASDLVAALGQEEAFALRTLEAMEPLRDRLPDYPVPGGPLLRRLQASIAEDRELAPPEAGDDSLTVHGCAGALRQVEVLRDQVLGLLQRDETLQARDVLVMCTDLDVYAPLIAQVFGTTAAPLAGPTRDLRVSVADRVARIDNPALQLAQSFVALLAGRMTRSEVLDLFGSPPVAERFELDADDRSRLERLVRSANVRWGLGAHHRTTVGVDIGSANTWQMGIDRLAAGLAGDGRQPGLMNGVAPVERAGDDYLRLVAALDLVVTALHEAWQFAQTSHPAREWAEAISGWVEPLVGGEARWRLPAALAVVSDALAGDSLIGLDEVRSLLADELSRYGPRPRLLAGGVDVVAMRPMRNIPFRVICLVGMDDDAFPRSDTWGGNDLLAFDPQPGERDPRAEDRQLFLDAICAAQQHLVITYTSRDPVSGHARPPAAPLAELLDVVGKGARHHHPLVPHDPQNFVPDATAGGSVSFDRAAAAVASRGRTQPDLLRDVRLAPVDGDVSLDDLLRFWKNPAKAFLRELGLPVEGDEEADDLEVPIDLTPLEKWTLGEDLLLGGRPIDEIHRAANARGSLPVVRAGSVWTEVTETAAGLRTAADQFAAGETEYLSLRLPLDSDGATLLTGALPYPATGHLVDVSYSRLKADHLLALRIRLAALAASGIPVRGRLIRKGDRKPEIKCEQPAEPGAAMQWLRGLAYLRRLGLTRPLPFAPQSSAAFAAELPDSPKGLRAAAKEWRDGYNSRGEGSQPENRMVWGSDFDTLIAVPPMTVGGLLPAASFFEQVATFVFGERP